MLRLLQSGEQEKSFLKEQLRSTTAVTETYKKDAQTAIIQVDCFHLVVFVSPACCFFIPGGGAATEYGPTAGANSRFSCRETDVRRQVMIFWFSQCSGVKVFLLYLLAVFLLSKAAEVRD